MAECLSLSTLRDALPAVSSAANARNSRSQTTPQPTTDDLNLLLWNIHGKSDAGMAEARKMLVQEVVRACDPDILLLQEVVAHITVSKFIEDPKRRPGRQYGYCNSGKRSEAYIVYDQQRFQLVSTINVAEVIGDENILGNEPSTTTRSGTSPSQEYYGDHTCAIRVQQRATKKVFVMMSFHNGSNRTLGKQPNVILYAKGFLTLVDMVHRREGVPVIAGGDFNCDRSDLSAHAKDLNCTLPDYTPGVRRTSSDKIDLYVIKSSTPVNSTVEVFEALPLADPTSATEHDHPLGRSRIRYLVDNAPEVKKTGKKLQLEDYTQCTNHDPTLNTVQLH